MFKGGVSVPSSELQEAFALRRCIIEHLYTWFKAHPLAPVELRQLSESCGAPAKEINWNLVYLEKKGWIALDLSGDCPPFVACCAELTGAGVDLAENPESMGKEFGSKGPDQRHYLNESL